MAKIGDRVGAIMSNKDGIMNLFGYGVYNGAQVPDDPNVKAFGYSLKDIGLSNPEILLDNGEKVYGCECWWGDEERVKEAEKSAIEVIHVSPTEQRLL